MSECLLEGHATDLWRELVREGGAHLGAHLDDELESYLVFLLMRHQRDAPLLGRIFAVELLQAMQLEGTMRANELRDVGDRCLIVSGLYPEHAARRRVSASYFLALGQGAYLAAAERARAAYASLYLRVAEAYAVLVEVLMGVRAISSLRGVKEPCVLGTALNGVSVQTSTRRH